MERSRPRPRVPRATEGAVNNSTHFTRAPSYWPAFALRGRPLSAALSSPAPAGQVMIFGSQVVLTPLVAQ